MEGFGGRVVKNRTAGSPPNHLTPICSSCGRHVEQTRIPERESAPTEKCQQCQSINGSADIFEINTMGDKLCTVCIKYKLTGRLLSTGLDPYENKIFKSASDLMLTACGVLPAIPNSQMVTSHKLRLDALDFDETAAS